MTFTELMQNGELRDRYKKVKQFFFLKESAYDVTSICQLRCEGCYYFAGDKYKVKDVKDPERWRTFLQQERARGINYVNLAGAEPSLVPQVLDACFETISMGTVFTNGLKPIASEIGYRIHISVWGDSAGDPLYRPLASGKPGPQCLPQQLKNYKADSRVMFVYTFNENNVTQVDDVLRRIHDEGHKITFNVYSSTVGGTSPLNVGPSLDRIREKMIDAMERYPNTVVYSRYNAEVHTSSSSLRTQFGCPYPRAVEGDQANVGISRTFRSYRADFTHVRQCDCCIPDTDCMNCRHYAAGSAIVTHRLDLHTKSEEAFRGWLDYVDTYLAVWLLGYTKGANLY